MDENTFRAILAAILGVTGFLAIAYMGRRTLAEGLIDEVRERRRELKRLPGDVVEYELVQGGQVIMTADHPITARERAAHLAVDGGTVTIVEVRRRALNLIG
ncbi:MAG: hypothetical protein ACK4RV_10155 [Caulobacter sp.]